MKGGQLLTLGRYILESMEGVIMAQCEEDDVRRHIIL
jgi:hypothetical protein